MDNDKDKSLVAHLEELRSTLIKCVISIGVIFPFAFYISPKALNRFVKILIGKNNITLNFFSPMEVFLVQIKLALLISALVAFPYIIKKISDYVTPALYEKERKAISKFVFVSAILFLFGCLFCLFVILPLIISFGMSFSGGNINAMFGVANIINLALGLVVVFGLMFQIPLVVNFLIGCDIVSYQKIACFRPYVTVILLIFCAILTPPDIISQLLLFIPTYMLFELGLLLSRKS